MRSSLFSTLLVASAANLVQCQDQSTDLFVAATNGLVHRVKYDPAGSGTLILLNNSPDCGSNPSWLFKGQNTTRFWCLDEGTLEKPGSLNRLDEKPEGSLGLAVNSLHPGNPVHASIVFGFDYIASAIYDGINGSNTGGGVIFEQLKNGALYGQPTLFVFPNMTKPGPVPDRQLVPHGHGIAADPTNEWVVVTDLGADMLRVYNRGIDGVKSRNDLDVYLEPGTGPRHATFFSHSDGAPIYLFVVNEFANTIHTYNVSYIGKSMQIEGPSRVISTFAGSRWPNNTEIKQNAKAGEIKVSPDNRFVAVSNRLVKKATDVESYDSISTFIINADGSLVPVDYAELSLPNPRAFEFNPTGDRVVVNSYGARSMIAVYQRTPETGKINTVDVASLVIDTKPEGMTEGAGINHAIWDYNCGGECCNEQEY